MLAIGIIDIFYLLRKKSHLLRCLAATFFHVLFRNRGIYWFGLLAFVPILLYNGRRGKGFKGFFYLFYPGHLLLIWLLRKAFHN